MTTDLLKAIQGRLGPHALSRLGEKGPSLDSRAIPTEFREFDLALGVGGIPRGKIAELLGPPSSGAFTLALSILAHAEERGAPAAFIDLPQSLDADSTAQLGVDLERLVIL